MREGNRDLTLNPKRNSIFGLVEEMKVRAMFEGYLGIRNILTVEEDVLLDSQSETFASAEKKSKRGSKRTAERGSLLIPELSVTEGGKDRRRKKES